MLNADFIIDPVTVVFGNTITFTDQSEGDVVTWNWTFDGGTPTTSTDTIVEVLYPTIGTYLVTLAVSDGVDVSTKTETVYVVNPSAPDPDFVADTTVVMVGESINFLDLTTDGPENWLWTFQGGSPISSSDQNPTQITYNIPGEFNVYLTTGNFYGTAYHTKFQYIKVIEEEPIVEDCDTISNFGSMDALVVENVTGGLFPGVNGLNISEYAELYDNSAGNWDKVNGLRIWVHIASASSSNSIVRFKIWSGNTTPDNLLDHIDVEIQDMTANFVHTVTFDDPVDVSGLNSIFVGYSITPFGSDQFAASIADDRGAGGLSTMYMNYNNNWFQVADMSVVNNIHTSLGVEPIACNTTGIMEFEYSPDNIVLYPNPTTDLINISFGKNKLSHIKVYNIMGKLVNVPTRDINNALMQLDFVNNANGIYFVSMIVDDKVITKKIILNR
ncbi:MAG: PKD domain-containing protein [Bacteroidota bacterium]|nr:PKD domain-containing protein [Bacteroidota bacterium]